MLRSFSILPEGTLKVSGLHADGFLFEKRAETCRQSQPVLLSQAVCVRKTRKTPHCPAQRGRRPSPPARRCAECHGLTLSRQVHSECLLHTPACVDGLLSRCQLTFARAGAECCSSLRPEWLTLCLVMVHVQYVSDEEHCW